jgi:hypothetical protein
MNSDLEIDVADEQSDSGSLGQWLIVIFVSMVLLVLTFNPLLTGLLPYLRAGWPAFRTAVWLKGTDPWRNRGTVGMLFHLSMALFCAGACAFFCIVSMGIVAHYKGKQPDLTPFIIAILTIAAGCALSSVLGWIGIVMALRHRIRIFVKSSLYSACRGDFAIARSLGPARTNTNPANYIIAVATAAPLLTAWCAAIIIFAPGTGIIENELMVMFFLLSLPFGVIACIAAILFVSHRITARSPAECWGAEIPASEKSDANWYEWTV